MSLLSSNWKRASVAQEALAALANRYADSGNWHMRDVLLTARRLTPCPIKDCPEDGERGAIGPCLSKQLTIRKSTIDKIEMINT